MWVDNDRFQNTGKRNIQIGEALVEEIPPHRHTLYTGPKPIGTDSSAFTITDKDCPGREARVCRVFTTPIPTRAGGVSHVGIGFASCTHGECAFVVPVTIDDHNTLVIMRDSPNRS